MLSNMVWSSLQLKDLILELKFLSGRKPQLKDDNQHCISRRDCWTQCMNSLFTNAISFEWQVWTIKTHIVKEIRSDQVVEMNENNCYCFKFFKNISSITLLNSFFQAKTMFKWPNQNGQTHNQGISASTKYEDIEKVLNVKFYIFYRPGSMWSWNGHLTVWWMVEQAQPTDAPTVSRLLEQVGSRRLPSTWTRSCTCTVTRIRVAAELLSWSELTVFSILPWTFLLETISSLFWAV